MDTTPTEDGSPARFVRYAPEIDAVSANFAQELETVLAGVEQYVVSSVESEGAGRAVRLRARQGVRAREL